MLNTFFLPKRRFDIIQSIRLLLHCHNPDADKVLPGEVSVPGAAGLVDDVDDVVLGRVLAEGAEDVADLTAGDHLVALEDEQFFQF